MGRSQPTLQSSVVQNPSVTLDAGNKKGRVNPGLVQS